MKPSRILKGHESPIYCIIADSKENGFLTGSGDGFVVRWNLLDKKEGEAVVNVKEAVFALHLIESRNLLLIGTEGGGIHVIDLNSNAEIKLFKVHEKGVFCFEQLQDGWILAGGGDGSVSIWDPATLTLVRQIPIAEGKIRHAALSPMGLSVAIASTDGTVRILDTEFFNERSTIKAHDQGTNCVSWHPRKPVLLSGGRDGHLRAWHTEEEYRQVVSIPAHEQTIYRMAFSENGVLATVSRDKSAKIWDASDLEVEDRLDHSGDGHTHSVNDLLWVGKQLVTVNDDGLVRLFSI